MRVIQLIKYLIGISYLFMFGYALDIPSGAFADGRIQFVEYNPDDVVQVNASIALGSQIVFSQDEEILDIASGFSQGWEFSDRRNILFLKAKSVQTDLGAVTPNAKEWNTNLLVTTNKRLYAFDLRLVDRPADDAVNNPKDMVAYRVQFKYSKDEAVARNTRLSEERAKRQKELMAKETERRLKNNRYDATNWDYTMQVGTDSRDIAPHVAYDDGRFTYLKFSELSEFPVAFLVESTREESIINSHVEGDFLVLHRVAKTFVLRSGKQVIGIYNEGFDRRTGRSNASGATVPGVKRIIKPSI